MYYSNIPPPTPGYPCMLTNVGKFAPFAKEREDPGELLPSTNEQDEARHTLQYDASHIEVKHQVVEISLTPTRRLWCGLHVEITCIISTPIPLHQAILACSPMLANLHHLPKRGRTRGSFSNPQTRRMKPNTLFNVMLVELK